MTESPARVLRPRVRGAIRKAFVDRGWTPPRGQATDIDAPETLVEPPLRFEWRVDAEGAKYGGIRLSGSGAIRHDEVAAVVAAFPDDALPRVSGSVKERATYFSLDWVSTYGLAKGLGWTAPPGNLGTWLIESEAAVAPTVGSYFELIDGPLQDWLGQRRAVQAVIEGPTAERSYEDPTSVRAIAVLALTTGRPDLARQALAGFHPHTDPERAQLRRFEEELIARYPQYGDPSVQ